MAKKLRHPIEIKIEKKISRKCVQKGIEMFNYQLQPRDASLADKGTPHTSNEIATCYVHICMKSKN